MTLQEWLHGGICSPWAYQQTDLIKLTRANIKDLPDPGGVCFRLSFKWLACKVYGRPFKFDITEVKGQKVIAKQMGYLNEVAPYERVLGPLAQRGDPYLRFFENVDRISVSKLNEWGMKPDKHGPGMKYNLRFRSVRKKLLSTATEFGSDAQFVIGVYGTVGLNRLPWAHATAFYRNGGNMFYFDSNGGEFTFGPGDNAAALVETDLQRYGGAPFRILDYALYLA